MRDHFLRKLAVWHTTHTKWMVVLIILISAVMLIISTRLDITMRWSDLLPSSDPRTTEYNRIIEEFKTASNIVIVLQGEEDRIKAFADTLAPRLESVFVTDSSRTLQTEIESLTEQLRALSSGSPVDRRAIQMKIDSLRSAMTFHWIQRVDYKIESNFLKKHAFMLMKESDLKNSRLLYSDPNLVAFLTHLNDVLELEYVGQDESISTREQEDGAYGFLDAIQQYVVSMDRTVEKESLPESHIAQVSDRFITGEPYFLSYDKHCLLLIAIPNFTIMDIDRLIEGTQAVKKLLDTVQISFPDVETGLTGFIPLAHDEMVYSQKSLGYTTLIAFVTILILLIVSFRMWVAPLFAMLNLIVGTIWAVGTVTLVVGQLNIMTQMMAVILMGLGIDFSIHLISAFTERRALGDSILESLIQTFTKSGKGVITGGLTTSFAFLSLIISRSRGMKELGLVTGTGLLAILLATFIVVPVFLVLRERRHEKRRSQKNIPSPAQRDISFQFLGKIGHYLGNHFRLTLIISIMITLCMIMLATHIRFDQNYMNIEPKGLKSVALQDTILNRFDLMIDYALILTEDQEASRRVANACRELSTVALVEDIGSFVPSDLEQDRRSSIIRQMNRTMDRSVLRKRIQPTDFPDFIHQFQRLRWNILEIQSMAYLGGQDKVELKCSQLVGDPDDSHSIDRLEILIEKLQKQPSTMLEQINRFHRIFGNRFKRSVLEASSIERITLDDLPESILDRYSNSSRTRYLVSVYPSGSIWQNAEFLHRFTDDMQRISIRATGMPPIFRALIDIIGKDGRNAIVLTIFIVFILLWIDFRSPKLAGFAMIPLAIGALWMVGLMHLTGMQFTVMNVMGLPLILGIGIDDGVHIVHRWIAEGQRDLRTVFSSTGKAILLTSLTTMLAFGSLVFSIWRGFGQLGGALFLGVGACFLTTILFLSGLMGFSDRNK